MWTFKADEFRAMMASLFGILVCGLYVLAEKLHGSQFNETFRTLFTVFLLFILLFTMRYVFRVFQSEEKVEQE